jgi:hypothetical protein
MKMKKIVFGVLIGVLIILSSCSDNDGYSLDYQWIGFGVLEDVDGSDKKIIMDNGDLLIPVAYAHNHGNLDQIYNDHHEKIENGERVFINYTIIGDEQDDSGEIELYYVRINSIRDILTKDVLDITPENEDSIGGDPIIVEKVWMSDDFLNFKVKYRGYRQTHFINLVKQPGDLMPEDQPFALELRHNANDDDEEINYVAYVSFRLGEIEITGLDSVEFVVTATDYDGDMFNYEGVYSYGENN